MKFAATVAALRNAVKPAAQVVVAKSTIPILSMLHVTAGKDFVSFRGTDLDRELTARTGADVDKQGSTCVDAKLLSNILAKLPEDGEAKFEVGGKNDAVSVRCGRSRFVLQTLPVEDFPVFTLDKSNHNFTLSAGDVAMLFGTTQFAISTEETRYYLNGVYLHAPEVGKHDQKVLRGVATDGHRLALANINLPDAAQGIPGVIVPRDTVNSVLKLAEKAKQLEVRLTQGRIVFDAGDVVLASKLIDGTFPDYMRVVPLGNDKTVKVETEVLRDAALRVATVHSERGPAVKLDIASQRITLSVKNPDAGSAEEEIEAEYDDAGHGAMTIGFNSRYLCDILSEIDAETVEIKLADPGSPTLFKPAGNESWTAVLMPMRV